MLKRRGIVPLATLMVTGLAGVVAISPPAAAAGSPLLTETFSGTSVADPAIVPLDAACLTAATAAPPAEHSTLGVCAKRKNSPPTTEPGYLQLTDASTAQKGAVLYDQALPANNGIQVTFEQYQYGGSGADGIAFFLVDGAVSLSAAGAPGGSLGYAQNNNYDGVRGGFLGVGLDAWGNFANDGESRGAGCQQASPRSGEQKNSVAVRGPGNGKTGYCWLADTVDTGLPGPLRGADLDGARRTARITVTPGAQPTVTVELDFGGGAGFQNVLTKELPSELPATFKFGLAASTGGATDVHLIRNVSVTSVEPLPPINLVKQVNQNEPQPESYTVGDVVPYDFVVTNTTAEPITAVSVSDPLVSSVSCPSDTLAPGGQPGATMVCTGSRTITAEDARQSSFTNTATVNGTASGDTPVSAQSSVTVPITPKADVSIVKQTTKTVVTQAGEEIPYTFTVTNVGNRPISEIAIDDDIVPQVTCPAATLPPGGETVCTGTYLTTQADLDAGQVANIASVNAKDPDGAALTDNSDVVVVEALHDPALTAVKATTVTAIPAEGEQVPYTFTVTNTGNVTLNGIAVEDPKVPGVTCPDAPLAPGGQAECTGSYTVTQADVEAERIVNQAGILGRTPGDQEVTGTSNQHILQSEPRLEFGVVKASPTTSYDSAGDKIDYTFTVTNTGNRELTDVTVTDALLGDGPICTFASLAPGARESCTAAYTVRPEDLDAGEVANRASVSGAGPDGETVSGTSNEVVVRGVFDPGLALVKSTSTPSFDGAGATIPFRFTVVNTGNVTVENVAVTDPLLPAVTCPKNTVPTGGEMDCEGTYTVTQKDVDAGRVVNVATVTGNPPGGDRLPEVASNKVEVTAAGAPDVGTSPAGAGSPVGQPAGDGRGQATVGGEVTERGRPSAGGDLPRTGRDVATLLAAAFGLLALGRALTATSRRQPQR